MTTRKKHLRTMQFVNAVFTTMQRFISSITFTNEDFKAVDPKQDDPMVIKVEIKCFVIKKVLVDHGSSMDILYWETFKKLQISEDKMHPYVDEIVGFSGESRNSKVHRFVHHIR